MEKIKIVALTLLISICSGYCMASEPLITQSISIKIVPTSINEDGRRSIVLRNPSDKFYVVMSNNCEDQIRIWKENNSWGYFNLSFQVKGENGKIFLIKKAPRGWNKNFPDWTVVPSKDHRVFEVTFDKSSWENSSLPEEGGSATIKLKAFFEIRETKEAKKYRVWTGSVSSDESEYTLYR